MLEAKSVPAGEPRPRPRGLDIDDVLPIRDALAAAREAWLRVLEQQVALAQAAGDIPSSLAAPLLAFEIDALLGAANISRNLGEDATALDAAWTVIALRLGIPAA